MAMVHFHAVVVGEIEDTEPRWAVMLDTVGDPQLVQIPAERPGAIRGTRARGSRSWGGYRRSGRPPRLQSR